MDKNGLINQVDEYQEWAKLPLQEILDIVATDYRGLNLTNIHFVFDHQIASIKRICTDAIGYIEMLEEQAIPTKN